MKTIKIKILGHSIEDPCTPSYFIYATLIKYYDVELSEDPDYLFFNEASYDHYKYSCIKIFYTGENVSPNFNTCDYAFSFDYMNFGDRHYRLPLYLITTFYNPDEIILAGKNYLNEKKNYTKDDLLKKTEFCSFVFSNYRADVERRSMFETLSTYKKVNAAGSYLNNTGGGKVKNKLEYEMKHKFVIAFENSSRSGYTTEKLVSALVAGSVPIYWGNPDISREFNTKRFINCHDFKNFEEVLDRVKEIDTNDELYLSIVNEPIASNVYNFDDVLKNFEAFIKNIIDQPLETAVRCTINPVHALVMKDQGRILARYVFIKNFAIKNIARIYKPFKRIKLFEKFKYRYFSKK